MLPIAEARAGLRPNRGTRWLLCSLIALAGFAGTATAGTSTGAASKATYRAILLTTKPVLYLRINNKGQVAFTEEVVPGRSDITRGKFYDGHRVRDIGTLGGPSTVTQDLNDLGQVTGYSTLNAEPTNVHAYRWSQATGMVDIGKQVGGPSRGAAINNKGQVAGAAEFGPAPLHAFFWSPQTGALDIGALGNNSLAFAINDAGTVVGASESGDGGRNSLVAFRWTRSEGIRDLGTFPSEFGGANDINEAGYIVGATPFMPNGQAHAFVWRPRAGLLDLGGGSGGRSNATKINNKGMVIGYTINFLVYTHGFIWTRQAGFLEIGAGSPQINTSANDVNNLGQVVGAYDGRAYVWTRAGGFVDLNTRVAGLPKGLKLSAADAIADNGTIVAEAGNAFYLLVPTCGCHHAVPPGDGGTL